MEWMPISRGRMTRGRNICGDWQRWPISCWTQEIILIVTAIELTQEDLELIQTTIHSDKIETIWIGDKVTTDIPYDLKITEGKQLEEAVDRIREMLREKGILSNQPFDSRT